jgi:hypothetical protein
MVNFNDGIDSESANIASLPSVILTFPCTYFTPYIYLIIILWHPASCHLLEKVTGTTI